MRKHSTACGINEVAIAVGYRQKGVWSLDVKRRKRVLKKQNQLLRVQMLRKSICMNEKRNENEKRNQNENECTDLFITPETQHQQHHAVRHHREITTATGGKGGVAAGTGQNP
jgi:hypothetical protein